MTNKDYMITYLKLELTKAVGEYMTSEPESHEEHVFEGHASTYRN